MDEAISVIHETQVLSCCLLYARCILDHRLHSAMMFAFLLSDAPLKVLYLIQLRLKVQRETGLMQEA